MAALALLAPLPRAWSDVYLVVSASNPQRSLSQKEALDLYMGRTRSFPGGELAATLDLPRDNLLHHRFYEALTGLSLAQVNSYRARLTFSGQTPQPRVLQNEQNIVDELRRNPAAIGYLSVDPGDRGLRTVLVLKTTD